MALRSSSTMPVQKVAAAGLAGAAVTVLIWLVRQVGGVEMPADVTSALTTVITFGAAYIVPPGDNEVAAVRATRRQAA